MDTPATLEEALAHIPRSKRWATAVLLQILFPVGLPSLLAYGLIERSPSFFITVPWRLPLLLSLGAYWSVALLIRAYAELFLPRAPVTVVDNKLQNIGLYGIGGAFLLMVLTVLACFEVKDTHVLAACTGLVAIFIAGLMAFWVWLAHTYGASQSSTKPQGAVQQSPRAPI